VKINLEIHDDAIDKIVVTALKNTLKNNTDPQWAEKDSAEIAAACKTLLKYYGPPR
jgi:hypothetical protein